MDTVATQTQTAQNRWAAGEEAGRFQGRHAALAKPRRGKPVAALVAHNLTDPRVLAETLNEWLPPARRRGGEPVQEVSACNEL